VAPDSPVVCVSCVEGVTAQPHADATTVAMASHARSVASGRSARDCKGGVKGEALDTVGSVNGCSRRVDVTPDRARIVRSSRSNTRCVIHAVAFAGRRHQRTICQRAVATCKLAAKAQGILGH